MNKYNEIYSRANAMNIVEDDKKIWMALSNRNGICEIDKETHSARICKVFEEESLEGEVLYCHVEKVGNYLIFSPGMASKIAVYDLECDKVSYIPLRSIEFHCKQVQDDSKFWNIFHNNSDVYLLGYTYPAIIKINTESMDVTYITDWVKEVEKNIGDGELSGYFGDGHAVINNIAMIPLGCMNGVLELNLENDQTKLRKLDISMKGIGGLSSANGEHIWMVGKGSITNRVACWNIVKNSIKELEVPDMEEDVYDPFYAPICTSSKIFLMPISAPFIYEADLNLERVEKSDILGRNFKELRSALCTWWKTMAVRLRGEWLIYVTCDDFGWHEYNVVTGERKEYYICIEEDIEKQEEYYGALYEKWRVEKRIPYERKVPLQYLVSNEAKAKGNTPYCGGRSLPIGQKLYNEVCGNI